MKKLVVDQDKCIGCGTCTALYPKVFKLGNEGKAEVLDQAADTEENIKNAIDTCPVQAILYKEDDAINSVKTE